METIRWGIIGCGDVTEVKSGPAFKKVKNSSLIAVMRRNALKAKDYALRHHVSRWYDNAYQLIADPDINAIYVATPPASHEQYTVAALQAGKPVYVEKPMTPGSTAAKRVMEAADKFNGKVTVAHYRREQPMFKKIKQLINERVIGDIRFVNIHYTRPLLSPEELEEPKVRWRIDPSIAGGGLFHDLSPHQLDLMVYFFGKPEQINGISFNQAGLYQADDIVTGHIVFRDKIIFTGLWRFSVPADQSTDLCEIIGSSGKISFSVFDNPGAIHITSNGMTESIQFEKLEHVQQPMIESTVSFFLGMGPNPCTPQDGVEVMKIIDAFTGPAF